MRNAHTSTGSERDLPAISLEGTSLLVVLPSNVAGLQARIGVVLVLARFAVLSRKGSLNAHPHGPLIYMQAKAIGHSAPIITGHSNHVVAKDRA